MARAGSVLEQQGQGARDRQATPWPHSSFFDRDSRRLLTCDLGLDRIGIYDANAQDGTLTPSRQPFAQVSSGAGCRHLAFHPDGCFVYVVNELDCTLSVFAYDRESSRMTITQTVPTVPWQEVDTSQPAEVVISPDGTTLYVTNRGRESIGIFGIDQASGRLRELAQEPSLGRVARHIALSPDGAHAFVANQLSDEVVVFARNPADGMLRPTGLRLPVPSPSCCVIY